MRCIRLVAVSCGILGQSNAFSIRYHGKVNTASLSSIQMSKAAKQTHQISSTSISSPRHASLLFSTKAHQRTRRIKSPMYMSSATMNNNNLNLDHNHIQGLRAKLAKVGMIMFIGLLCVSLPIALFPPAVLHRLRLINVNQKERMSLRAGEFCSRWLLRLIPFAKINVIPSGDDRPAEPCIWVCNHTSMLDVFFLLATNKKLRGRNRRPLKVIYWEQLESNPITKLLFTACGWLPVDMKANAAGQENDYDFSSFKKLLRLTKKATAEGFDIGIFPEGQPNPTPEKGLLPLYSGAYTLAKMSKRPIRILAMSGLTQIWNPAVELFENVVKGKNTYFRCYPQGRAFESSDDFVETFTAVVGYFGTNGKDLPEDELKQKMGWE